MSERVISRHVTGVGFGFYSESEILALSVKRITVPMVYDNLGNPIANGLYDPALGPIERFDKCQTCSLSASACLGHMGHITLSVPVYQPLLFDLLFKVLRSACFVCHRLKMSALKVKLAATKLRLADAGLMLTAKQLDEMSARVENKNKETAGAAKKPKKKAKPTNSAFEDEDSASDDEATAAAVGFSSAARLHGKLDALLAAAAHHQARHEQLYGRAYQPSAHEVLYRSELERQFVKDLAAPKCSHCQSFSPVLRKDAHSKLFRLPLTQAQQRLMAGRKFADVLAITSKMNQQKNQSAMNDKESDEPQYKSHVERMLHMRMQDADDAAAGISSKNNNGSSSAHKSKSKSSQGRGLAEYEAALAASRGDSGKSKKSSSNKKKSKLTKKQVDRQADDSDAEGSDDPASDDSAQSDDSDIEMIVDPSLMAAQDQYGGAALASARDAASATKRVPVLMFANEVEAHMQLLWDKESNILNLLWGSLATPRLPHIARSALHSPHHAMFFLRTLGVPPTRFRPPTRYGDMTIDHPQNVYLKTILECDAQVIQLMSAAANSQSSPHQMDDMQQFTLLIGAMIRLQEQVNLLLDSSKAANPKLVPQNGIRQLFEKKEGLFRKCMMGKRVNFAARSVISPDPFLHTSEIGVPEMFATQLTFPEPVTSFNVAQMRQAVQNGAEVHPGANYIEDESGRMISLAGRTYDQRVALSKTLLTNQSNAAQQDQQFNSGARSNNAPIVQGGVKRVLRHIRSGDVMLVNRQPTLHKPSMMAHKVRVLKGRNKMWQTIRMHYANCNTYNADFDGDEMNLHVPQNQLARAEAYHIANTDNQYLVPTDGSPLRGLIQDNVLTGVLITKLDTYFTRDQFQQLLWSCSNVSATQEFHTPLPCIIKPLPLWSGKQLVSCILDLVTGANRPPLCMTSRAKVPAALWGQHKEEANIIIRHNHLVQGVLDKSQFGDAAYGLVHCVYELYGAASCNELLSLFGKCFTLYLQTHAGFTCGIDDMFLNAEAEARRRKLLESANVSGRNAACDFVGIEYQANDPLRVNRELARKLIDAREVAKIDAKMKSFLSPLTSEVIKQTIPSGNIKQFPENCMSMMISTGAKGSGVNFSQICCLLGQQELEGKRVPMMATGKTLPSFRRHDTQPRAGGYVGQRFLTGIKPNECFFHYMAGREGLIDTAVKTSRSGYLQRCLIKHLESLVVQYDHTVRDADQAVVQFHYGEDSVDVAKTAYLTDHFGFLAQNQSALIHKLQPQQAATKFETKAADRFLKHQTKLIAKQEKKQASMSPEERHLFALQPPSEQLDPVMNVCPPGCHLGSISESFRKQMLEYASDDPDGLFAAAEAAQNDPDSLIDPASAISKDKYIALMKMLYAYSLVHAGESVGILAAQSVGEPSTQMTLNTFHLAGHGGANVTLGIPRLREIVMTASANIKTPIMELPFLVQPSSRAEAERLAAQITRLSLGDYIVKATSTESMDVSGGGTAQRIYTVRLQFADWRSDKVKSQLLNFKHFRHCFEGQFVVRLNAIVSKQVKALGKSHAATPLTVARGGKAHSDETGVEASGRPSKSINYDDDAELMAQRAKKDDRGAYGEQSDDEVEMNEQLDRADAELLAVEDEASDDDDGKSEAGSVSASKGKARAGSAAATTEAGSDAEEDAGGEDDAAGSSDDALEIDDSQAALATTAILRKCLHVRNLRYSAKDSWAECELSVSLSLPKLLIMSSVEQILETVVLRQTSGIARCFVVEKKDTLVLQTDGCNFKALFPYSQVFDLNRLYSNDIAAILRTYGVEAARQCIAKEVTAVFDVYGISVDARHLSLIADYMTFHGGYKALNRGGIDSSASPFQKISFETSITFLKDACLRGEVDRLISPSARIVLGKPVNAGTGCFELLHPLR